MPACRTPELWPVWWKPGTASRSSTVTASPGRRAKSSRATARPMMPAPTTTTSGSERGVADGGLSALGPRALAGRRAQGVEAAFELDAVARHLPADLELAGLRHVSVIPCSVS